MKESKLARICCVCQTMEYPLDSGRYYKSSDYNINDYTATHTYMSQACLSTFFVGMPNFKREMQHQEFYKQLPETCKELTDKK